MIYDDAPESLPPEPSIDTSLPRFKLTDPLHRYVGWAHAWEEAVLAFLMMGKDIEMWDNWRQQWVTPETPDVVAVLRAEPDRYFADRRGVRSKFRGRFAGDIADELEAEMTGIELKTKSADDIAKEIQQRITDLDGDIERLKAEVAESQAALDRTMTRRNEHAAMLKALRV